MWTQQVLSPDKPGVGGNRRNAGAAGLAGDQPVVPLVDEENDEIVPLLDVKFGFASRHGRPGAAQAVAAQSTAEVNAAEPPVAARGVQNRHAPAIVRRIRSTHDGSGPRDLSASQRSSESGRVTPAVLK